MIFFPKYSRSQLIPDKTILPSATKNCFFFVSWCQQQKCENPAKNCPVISKLCLIFRTLSSNCNSQSSTASKVGQCCCTARWVSRCSETWGWPYPSPGTFTRSKIYKNAVDASTSSHSKICNCTFHFLSLSFTKGIPKLCQPTIWNWIWSSSANSTDNCGAPDQSYVRDTKKFLLSSTYPHVQSLPKRARKYENPRFQSQKQSDTNLWQVSFQRFYW